jgi:hypothetical protein
MGGWVSRKQRQKKMLNHFAKKRGFGGQRAIQQAKDRYKQVFPTGKAWWRLGYGIHKGKVYEIGTKKTTYIKVPARNQGQKGTNKIGIVRQGKKSVAFNKKTMISGRAIAKRKPRVIIKKKAARKGGRIR